MNDRPPSSSTGARLALAFAAIVLTLAFGELAVSLLFPAPKLMRFQQLNEAFDGRDEQKFIDVIFQNDPETFWRLAPSVTLPEDSWPLFGVISNGNGVREDHEISFVRTDPDEIRILFLGDSTIFGYLLPHSQTYSEVTERLLRARFPNATIECINAGVPGYGLFQGWRYLETEGLAYDPDVVIVGFGWNDAARWDGLGDAQHHALLARQRPPRLLQSSRLAELFFAALHPRPQTPNAKRPRLLPSEFRSLLEQMHEITRNRGGEFLVLVGAALFNVDGAQPRSYRTTLQLEQYGFGSSVRFGPERADGYIDTVPVVQALASSHRPKEILFDSVHPTSLVTERIGELIADRLDPWMRSTLLRRQIEASGVTTPSQ